MTASDTTLRITVAGFDNLLQQQLVRSLALRANTSIRVLCQNPLKITHSNIEWQECDFFFTEAVEQACAGTDVLIYLMPLADLPALAQWNIADNFSRALQTHGVQQVIVVSEQNHEKIQSQRTIENTLLSADCPLTFVRAGLILDNYGSTFSILKNIVTYSPVLLCPRWMNQTIEPIDTRDTIRYIESVIGNVIYFGSTITIAGPESFTFKQMLQDTARYLGLPRLYLSLPMEETFFSYLYLRLAGGFFASTRLLSAIMHCRALPEQERYQLENYEMTSFHASLKTNLVTQNTASSYTINTESSSAPKLSNTLSKITTLTLQNANQRITVADTYFRWLNSWFSLFLSVEFSHGYAEIKLLGLFPLFKLRRTSDSTKEIDVFHMEGGLLVNAQKAPNARIEFRRTMLRPHIIIAIHDYLPTLPGWLYRGLQVPAYDFILNRFRRFIEQRT